ncbi:MAG: DUF58 domain-containing protein [Armatimonadota bacterium]|nr:MAG: DUF58 domain-containing protein [Armatimonadota bacterium]
MVLPLLWILLAALALVLSWTTDSGAFAWVGYLMLLIWVVGLAVVWLAERGVSVSRQLSSDRVPFGGEADVEVQVSSGSVVPLPWLAAAESLPAGLPMTGVRGRVGPLAGRGKFSFRYTLHGARRGYHQVGPTLLRTGDLFGLVQRERAGGRAERLTVYPRIIAIRHVRVPSHRPAGEVRARQRVLEDPTQVVGVRPYQHGDGLRRVHWRATAHTGRLQSKLFEVSAQVETTLVLNVRRGDYPDSPAEAEEAAELAIVTAASVAQHVLDQRQPVGLVALARDPAEETSEGIIRVSGGRGRGQLAAILSVLGRVELGPAKELADVLSREKDELPWGSAVVIITPRMTDRSVPAIRGLRKAGFETSVILVGRSPGLAEGGTGLEALGVGAARVISEADIRGLSL